MRQINIIGYLFAFLFFNSTILRAVYAADITDFIKQETQLDEQVKKACLDHCQGNRKQGELQRFLIERISSDNFFVRAEVELINHHHVEPPELFGRNVGSGFDVYKYSIIVVAEGSLNSNNCMLTIDKIELENDQLGLSSLARGQEGKTYPIEECRKFTSRL